MSADELPPPNPRRNWFAVWHWPKWRLVVIAALLGTLSDYIILYWALLGGSVRVKRIRSTEDGGQVVETVEVIVLPVYRIESVPGTWAEHLINLLAPAHQIDRWVRPKYWSVDPGNQSK